MWLALYSTALLEEGSMRNGEKGAQTIVLCAGKIVLQRLTKLSQ
jgi:hypothetical protein